MKLNRILLCIIITAMPIFLSAQNKHIRFSGKLHYKNPGKQLTLNHYSDLVYDYSVEDNKLEPSTELKSEIINGNFEFSLKDVPRSSYIFLLNYSEQDNDEKRMMYTYYAEPGDDVFVNIKKVAGDTVKGPLGGKNGSKYYVYNTLDLKFSGKGSAKYQLQADLQRQSLAHSQRIGFYTFMSKKDLASRIQSGLDSWDSLKRVGIALLNKARSNVSEQAFQVIKANFIGDIEQKKLYLYYWHCANNDNFLKELFYKNFKAIEHAGSEFARIHSPKYISYASYYIEQRKYADAGSDKEYILSSIYKDAIDLFGKIFGDRLLLNIMLTRKSSFVYSKNYDLVETGTKSKDPYVRLVANNIKKVIDENKPGSKPDLNFELTDVNGKKVKLDDFKGKVLFVDFWYTGCGPCTDYYTQVLKDVEAKYHSNKDIAFVTVSIDRNFEAWKASVEVGNYTGDKAINLYTNGLGGGHPLVRKFNISSYPTPMIFDKEGKIFSNESSVLRKKEGLIQKIEEALGK